MADGSIAYQYRPHPVPGASAGPVAPPNVVPFASQTVVGAQPSAAPQEQPTEWSDLTPDQAYEQWKKMVKASAVAKRGEVATM